MVSDNTSQQDQRSSQAPPTKKSNVYSDDAVESTLSRPPTLHKQPPALPPKPFTRIPNHITGDLSIFRWSSDPSTERVWFLAFLVQMGLRSGCHVCQWSCRLLYLQRSSWSPYLQAAWSPHRLPSRGALLPPATSRWEVIHCSTGRFRFTHQVESLRSSTKHWRSPCRGLRGKNLHISLPPSPPPPSPPPQHPHIHSCSFKIIVFGSQGGAETAGLHHGVKAVRELWSAKCEKQLLSLPIVVHQRWQKYLCSCSSRLHIHHCDWLPV